jgi:sulfite reductase (NADPH) hemoprotein beta-component
LQNGLYLQLHAYMLRVAVPYGTLNSAQMRCWAISPTSTIAAMATSPPARTSSTTGSSWRTTPDILADLASVEMHAIQTSGNCIRNISSDQYAGAAADEIVDPRPYAELLRQWSSFHPEFLVLPRKFKIAVIAQRHRPRGDEAARYRHPDW